MERDPPIITVTRFDFDDRRSTIIPRCDYGNNYGRDKGAAEAGPSGVRRVLDGYKFLGAGENRTANLREFDARGRSQCQLGGIHFARGQNRAEMGSQSQGCSRTRKPL